MKKYNIMIVDDNKDFVAGMEMMLTTFLSQKVNRISKAFSGEECLKSIFSARPDIIFMDYSMPGLDGAKVTKILCKQERFVKIIAISFHKEEKVMKEMIYAGSRGYIAKDELDVDTLSRYLTDDLENSYN